jgi:hypothetical protein
VTRYDDRVMLDPVIGILIVACFATLFASAAIHKLRDFARFDAVFEAYAPPPRLVRLRASRIVPYLEAAIALGLLGGASRGYAVATGVVLLCAYAAAIALNLWRGRRDIACGCGGADESRPIAAWMVWRNVTLAAVLATALLPWGGRALSATDAFTIACGVCAAALLYLACDRLFGATARRVTELRGSR